MADADAGHVGDRVVPAGPTRGRSRSRGRSRRIRSLAPVRARARAASTCATRRIIARGDPRGRRPFRRRVHAPSGRRAFPERARRGARRSTPPRRSATCRGSPCSRAPDRAQRPLDLPDRRPGRRPRGAGRRPGPVRGRAAARRPARRRRRSMRRRCAPPFLGGLVGFLGYDLGHALERLPSIAPTTRTCRRSGSRSTTGSSPGTGGPAQAWLGGRALDGDASDAWRRRLDDVHARADRRRAVAPAGDELPVDGPAFPPASTAPRLRGRRRGRPRPIARGDIYQANLTRRLEAPFDGDPWPLYRRLRTGDPSLFAAYLDLGRSATGRGRSCRPRPSRSSPSTGTARHDRPDQGHPAARPRPATRTARSPASCWPAPRTGPRT